MTRTLSIAICFCLLAQVSAAVSDNQPSTSPLSILNVRDYGAKADGSSDDTSAFQQALDAAEKSHSRVFVPAGRYMIRGHLTIPAAVTLEGISVSPRTSSKKASSVLLAVEGKGDPDGTPFIHMHTNSTLKGVEVFYPDQTQDIAPYPWCIRGSGDDICLRDILLINPYQAVDFGTTPAGRHYINGLYAGALKTGLFVDKCFDVGRVENVHFWPFWTTDKKVMDWMSANGTAFVLGRTDWEYMTNCFAISYRVGFHFVAREDGPGNTILTQCGSDVGPCAVRVDAVQQHAGVSFLNGQFMAGIEVNESNEGPVKFTACGFWGVGGMTGSHLVSRSQGNVTFTACHFTGWAQADKATPCLVAMSGGLTVNGCEFLESDPAKKHILLGESVQTAVVTGNRFRSAPRIENRCEGDVAISANVVARTPAIQDYVSRGDVAQLGKYWTKHLKDADLTSRPADLRLASAMLLRNNRTLRARLLDSLIISGPASFVRRAQGELALEKGLMPANIPLAKAAYASAAPVIDGKLDDPAWQKAAPATLALEQRDSATQTQMRLLWDRQALYIGIRVAEPAMDKIRADAEEHDGKVWLDDSVEFFLCPDRVTNRYLQLIVNSAGVLYDGTGSLSGTESASWNTRADVKTMRGQGEWTAEIRLTWSDIGHAAPVQGNVWTADMRRWRYAGGSTEYASWAGAPLKGLTHHAEAFGLLRFE